MQMTGRGCEGGAKIDVERGLGSCSLFLIVSGPC